MKKEKKAMLREPNCHKRKCKHFLGVRNDGDETTERNYCEAFPDRIPSEIAYGDNLHDKPMPDQDNDIVYEKA